ncbi:MAG TPA: phage tail sheath C-terminal domain-containing protein [Allosphingosinicella sp.]
MPEYPGVYIEELPSGPHSIPGVPTAVPALLGYTEKAVEHESGSPLLCRPYPIASMAEYEQAFGGAYGGALTAPGGVRPFLRDSLSLYFENGGGGTVWIVSAGDYAALESDMAGGTLAPARLEAALKAVGARAGPTLVAAPEALLMGECHYRAFAGAMLSQAAALGDRFVILDVPGDPSDGLAPVKSFQEALEPLGRDRSFGAAYFPPLRLSSAKTLVPPSGAVLGAIFAQDRNRGVWKAPSNLALKGVSGPAVAIGNREQEAMNAPANGVSVNPIRSFAGDGTLIWGARTLDSASGEYRYIPVRRFANYVEQSLKAGLEPFAFEPNDARAWTAAKAMIENFLTTLWRQHALMGAKPEEGFYVAVGLGKTMTAQDILEGRMIVEVGMAVVRPAEFILLRFMQRTAPP